ncbi:helix-turn-helix domain-containing protein [Acidipropionibacterium acidipropionici]|uniref:helix-turn-helix domain-containing protein n=1 Tax=Acidipropionibacterium acidipropionici TaxID=1748 RepID=UPI000A58E4D2|nr:helix-turn-helix domain-containing protein [Acidipropionibacterium acidipropionici]
MTLHTDLLTMVTEHALLDTSVAATAIGVTPWWVRHLISTGELRGINVGSHGTGAKWRIDPADLDAWIVSRQTRPRDLVGDQA